MLRRLKGAAVVCGAQSSDCIRMLRVVLLCLVLSGIQALPIFRGPTPVRMQDSEVVPLPDTEDSRRFILELSSGQVQDLLSEMDRTDVEDAPVQINGGGWVRVDSALPEGFRQGTEPSDPISYRKIGYTLPEGFRQGTEPSDPIAYRKIGDTLPEGFRQGTEPSDPMAYRKIGYTLPEGFRQGTEPSDPNAYRKIGYTLPEGFRQGTEPSDPIAYRKIGDTLPEGFRQGTEPSDPIAYRKIGDTLPEGFRQGTEPSDPIAYRKIGDTLPEGFRQGTEPSDPNAYRKIGYALPEGFRQGTEPSDPDSYRNEAMSLSAEHVLFQEGLEPSNLVMSGFRPEMKQLMVGFERSNEFLEFLRPECDGEVIYGRCYMFNPTPLPFLEAQDSCRRRSPNAELASVTNEDLYSRLVSMLTNGGRKEPVITWLGGMVKDQRGLWLDGSEWSFSDWSPGHPDGRSNKAQCVEIFRTESWSTADCDLHRASICSAPASSL